MSSQAQEEMMKFQRNCKAELCVGRCAYQFQVTEMKQDSEKGIEKVIEGILFCTSCGHTIDYCTDDSEE